ncbi:hypothetical protein EUTSA_v10026764mg [Eutrema salsugineum]|uniref:Cotton fiber protein n=1 Tax=Eutrema salsugineum TaxID=72664 RepID=V4MKX6_EUTSA|nr:uncharacterized protein LOC18029349 [Eutrema salsugineum]ESQ56167.1 hypothetical protein EUTSA_v10026764mg [Eutrema salsugineum]
MVSLRQKKKQNPAKRAWKSFTNMVRSKFRDIEIAASVRESTARVLRFLSHRLIVPFRTRYLENTSYTDKYYIRSNQTSQRFLNFFSRRPLAKTKRRHNEYGDSYSQFYQYQSQSRIEESSRSEKNEKAVGRKEETRGEEDEGMPEIADSMEDAWKRVVAASPHLRVDERADEFIYKFRESMKMEKERSFLEFQERLKRSA